MRRGLALAISMILGLGVVSCRANPEPDTARAPSEVRLELQGVPNRAGAFTTALLVNDSDRPIYLLWTYPGSSPVPQRRLESTGQWVGDHVAGQCGSVAGPRKPIPVPPGSRWALPVWWDDALGQSRGLAVFRSASGEEFPIPGTYRFVLAYAAEPWSGFVPGELRDAVSPPFEISE